MSSSTDVHDSLLGSSAIASYDSIVTSRADDPEDAFGGAEGRKILEKQLLRKLDRRVAFLVLVSIMNYVRTICYLILPQLNWIPHCQSWTALVQRQFCEGSFVCCKLNCQVLRAARLSGLEADLHMSGRQFNTLISILYVGYVLMQIPSYVSLGVDVNRSD
jgi:hypothetical protein